MGGAVVVTHSDLLYAVTVTVVFAGTLAGLGLVALADWLWQRYRGRHE